MEIKEACKPPAFGPIGLRLGNKHVTPQDYLRRDEQPAPGHGDIGRLANIAPGPDQGLLHSVAPWRGGHRDGACPPERPVHGRARTRMRIAAHRWHAPHRGAATVGGGRPRPPAAPRRTAPHRQSPSDRRACPSGSLAQRSKTSRNIALALQKTYKFSHVMGQVAGDAANAPRFGAVLMFSRQSNPHQAGA